MRARETEVEHRWSSFRRIKLICTRESLALSARLETALNRGVEGRLIQIRGDWLQIELAGDQTRLGATEKAIVDLP